MLVCSAHPGLEPGHTFRGFPFIDRLPLNQREAAEAERCPAPALELAVSPLEPAAV